MFRQALRLLGLALLVVFVLSPTIASIPYARVSWLQVHEPILIAGDQSFTPPNGVAQGSGTSSDPYIIEGWEIDLLDSSAKSGIEIRDTTAHFVIRDVRVYSGGNGTVLFNVKNGRVERITAFRNSYGIVVESSTDVEVVGNSLFFNAVGMFARSSARLDVADNRVFSNSHFGIDLYSSTEITVSGNEIVSNRYSGLRIASTRVIVSLNSFILDGLRLEGDYLSYDIKADNRVNGKPLIYYANCENLNIDGIPLGQLIIANCRNVRVANLHITNTYIGIEILSVRNGLIVNNEVSQNNDRGLRVAGSDNITIKSNTLADNEYALDLRDSTEILVGQNNILNSRSFQVFDIPVNGNSTSWDDGYPAGGNYWSDYFGGDNCFGPNQDICPNPDGIGDIPRRIDEFHTDRYPLMTPVGSIKDSRAPDWLSGSALETFSLSPTSVTLTWRGARDNVGVVKYRIYQDRVLLREVPRTADRYTVDDLVPGGVYFFRVEAGDVAGNWSNDGPWTYVTTLNPNSGNPLSQLLSSVSPVAVGVAIVAGAGVGVVALTRLSKKKLQS